jgi:hypothetical protein
VGAPGAGPPYMLDDRMFRTARRGDGPGSPAYVRINDNGHMANISVSAVCLLAGMPNFYIYTLY